MGCQYFNRSKTAQSLPGTQCTKIRKIWIDFLKGYLKKLIAVSIQYRVAGSNLRIRRFEFVNHRLDFPNKHLSV